MNSHAGDCKNCMRPIMKTDCGCMESNHAVLRGSNGVPIRNPLQNRHSSEEFCKMLVSTLLGNPTQCHPFGISPTQF